MKIGIIGAGVSGLATAIRMAVRGYEVHIYEANSYPGGKLTAFHQDEYRFDAGPSVFTMPEHFEELFQLAGEKFEDYCPYSRLDIITKYFFDDDTIVNAYKNPEDFANELQSKLGVPAKAIIEQIEKSKTIYDATKDIFLNKSLHTLKQHSPRDLLKASQYLRKLDLFKTMHQVNKKRLKNEKAVQLFDRFATYNGSNPYKAPGTLNVIPHLEHNVGCFFPKGGMHSLTQSLHELGKKLGISYHFDSPVERIIVKDKTATGLQINGEVIDFDKVVSAGDVFFTYRNLLKDQPAPEKVLQQEKSSSAIVFYWGIKRNFPELILHNILFSKNYEAEFTSLFKDLLPYDDPTVYINITSKHNTDDAPNGCENWFVMINAPNMQGQDWDEVIATARKNIIKKINNSLSIDIESLIATEAVFEPRLIQQRTNSHLGALYGNSSNNRMSAFLRHANFSNKIANLYFTGGSVHPGGGIPLCMLSAKIVDELMH